MADQTNLTCGNCGRVIGWMHTPSQIKEDVVCMECHERLAQCRSSRISAAPVSANPVRFSKPPKALRGVFWIGLILWLAALLDMTGGLPHLLGIFSLLSIPRITYSNVTLGVLSHLSVFSLLWLGAILCAGSLALWAIIVAWETYYKMHWHAS